MIYKEFKSNFIPASTIGLGCGVLLSRPEHGVLNDKDEVVIHEAIQNGINLFDTAEDYFNGESESRLGSCLWEYAKRDSIILCSKVSPKNLNPSDLIKSLENSLLRLKTDFMDIYYIHWPNPKVPIEDTIISLVKLKEQGKIRGIGLSNFYINKIKFVDSLCPVDAVEMEYNIFERFVEHDILPFCRDKHIPFVAYSPLNQAAINAEDLRIISADKICKKYNKTFFQVMLNWLHRNQGVFPIPKSSSLSHLYSNISSTDFILDEVDNLCLSDTFKFKIESIKPSIINPTHPGRGNKSTYYSTMDDALQNKLNFNPSPHDLAQELKEDPSIKPIKVMFKDGEYFLIEGRLRYWAWVIAFGSDCPIMSSVNEL